MPNFDASFAVYLDVPVNNNFACYIPGHVTSSSYYPTYININMYLQTSNFYTRYYPAQYYTPWANYGATRSYTDSSYSGGLSSVS